MVISLATRRDWILKSALLNFVFSFRQIVSRRERSVFSVRISGVIKGLDFVEEVVIFLVGAYLSRRHFSVLEKIER